MKKQHDKISKSPHVLLITFPAQGHINPLIQFAKRLTSKGVKTTLITTIFFLKSNFIDKTNTTSIELEAISDGFDDGYANVDSPETYLKTFKEVGSRSLAELIKKLLSEGSTIDAIIYDSFVTWALDVAMEFGIICEWMRKKWKLMAIGPTLPSMYLDKRLEDDKDYGFNLYQAKHNECNNWLNDKPKKSVVYVSFGSSSQLGSEQMKEIAWGLSDSNVNFLWVVRKEEEEKLPNEIMEKKLTGKGMVVTWCRQLDVLAHESVGCFITHCGFNSILEAISLGVPMVGMPQWSDQITNAKFLEEIWDVGVRVKADENGIVRRENLVTCIKTIMEEERGVIVRTNAEKWRDLAKLAVDEGGSSDKDIDEFVYELIKA
ncbi:hypothetical protein E3N88_09445 [Mikania micrantha]|uniref:Uncharacterized protein n=1 Tax=Mikania micrantha TaxID=192012 RepID=A0A5N6PJ19_9ASTR|nr:hypothetical protein E3N88_09445 [Mikania micrantha]